jgi:hypothetical protein
MGVHTNEDAWVIEDNLDIELQDGIAQLINRNLSRLLKWKKGYSTTGAGAENYWLKKNKWCFVDRDEFDRVESGFKSAILDTLAKYDLSNAFHPRNAGLLEQGCWSVIGHENSYHVPHSHYNPRFCGISTIVYLRVPETNLETSPDNNIYILMRARKPVRFSSPPFCQVLSINPIVGKLLIFPTWLVHGTCPQTRGIRQTFNVDYAFTECLNLDDPISQAL